MLFSLYLPHKHKWCFHNRLQLSNKIPRTPTNTVGDFAKFVIKAVLHPQIRNALGRAPRFPVCISHEPGGR